jgi:hypothetical protein
VQTYVNIVHFSSKLPVGLVNQKTCKSCKKSFREHEILEYASPAFTSQRIPLVKFLAKLLALVVLAIPCVLTSCAGPSSVSYQNVTLTLTPELVCNGCFQSGVGTGYFYYQPNPVGAGGFTGAYEMPQGGGTGGCIQLFANITNAPLKLTWAILPAPNPSGSSSNVGTLSDAAVNSNFYCEPSSIPVYTGAQLAAAKAAGIVDVNGNVVQGTTEVRVTNPIDPTDPTKVISASMFFTYEVQNPPTGVIVGINGLTLPANVTVPLGGTYQFNGYVGGVNGFGPCTGGNGTGVPTAAPAYGVTYTVNNGAANGTGAGQYGTISATGLYTAPTNYPSSTVKSVAVIVSSTACPTIISPAVTVLFP